MFLRVSGCPNVVSTRCSIGKMATSRSSSTAALCSGLRSPGVHPWRHEQSCLLFTRWLSSKSRSRKQQTQLDEHGPPPLHVRMGKRFPAPDLQAIKAIRAESQGTRESNTVQKFDVWNEHAVSHSSGISILFLGTGLGAPNEQRSGKNTLPLMRRRAGSVALKLHKSTWMFDAGEDTQRQVHKQPLVRNGKVDRIFITNRRAGNVLGLPGLLCTMSAARCIGMDFTDVPLHIYGPPGLSEFIRPLLHLSDTYIAMPLIVHELVEHAVRPEQANTPELLDKRSCLYRVLVPPDKLNPQGYTTDFLERMFERGTYVTKGMGKKDDERVNHRPLKLPLPGDVDAAVEGMHDLSWTFLTEKERLMTARRVPASIESYVYVMQEADRIGRLNVDAAEKFGIYGKDRNTVKAGLPVTNKHGVTVVPEQVCGPDIVGRKVAVVGESTDSSSLAEACRGADALIHAASCTVVGPDGSRRVQSALGQASALTKASGCKHLLLYKFKPESEEENPDTPQTQEAEVLTEDPEPDLRLNLLNKFQPTRKGAINGYLWRADNAWHPNRSPLTVRQAAESYMEGHLAGEHGFSIPDDMDVFYVSRQDIDDTPTVSHSQALDTA